MSIIITDFIATTNKITNSKIKSSAMHTCGLCSKDAMQQRSVYATEAIEYFYPYCGN